MMGNERLDGYQVFWVWPLGRWRVAFRRQAFPWNALCRWDMQVGPLQVRHLSTGPEAAWRLRSWMRGGRGDH